MIASRFDPSLGIPGVEVSGGVVGVSVPELSDEVTDLTLR